MNKIEAFEYFLYLLIKKYCGIGIFDTLDRRHIMNFNNKNDFSRVKLNNLVYLYCAKNEDYDVFDDFAYIYDGAAEVDIYNYLIQHESNNFYFGTFNKLTIKNRLKIYKNLRNEKIEQLFNPETDGFERLNAYEVLDSLKNYENYRVAKSLARAFEKLVFPIEIPA